MSLIGRDLFARGAAKAAEKARPDQEALRHVDEAAPPEQWESKDGVAGSTQTPHPTATVGDHQVTHNTTTGQTVVQQPDGTTRDAGDLAQGTAQQAQDLAARHVDETAKAVTAENPDGSKKTIKQRFAAGYQSVTDRIPDEHKDRAGDQIERGKNFLRDEFPEERRDQFIYRFKKVSGIRLRA